MENFATYWMPLSAATTLAAPDPAYALSAFVPSVTSHPSVPEPTAREPEEYAPEATAPDAIVTAPPPPPPPAAPPPDPVGNPAPPVMFTVVVDVLVMHESCVEDPTVNANHELGGIGCEDVVAVAPSAQ